MVEIYIDVLKNLMLDDEFERSVDAVVHGDIFQLKQRLVKIPGLDERGQLMRQFMGLNSA